MTTALEGGEGSALRTGRSLPPGKTRYPLYKRLGGPPGPVWTGSGYLAPPGFDPRTVQPEASRYTDYATRPTIRNTSCSNLNSDTVYSGEISGFWNHLSFLHFKISTVVNPRRQWTPSLLKWPKPVGEDCHPTNIEVQEEWSSATSNLLQFLGLSTGINVSFYLYTYLGC